MNFKLELTEQPVDIVLENTLGNITFGYSYAGGYYVIADPLFPFTSGKSCATLSNVNVNDTSGIYPAGSGTFGFDVKKNGVSGDDILTNNMIEIRVYN